MTRTIRAGCFVCHGTEERWTSANAHGLAAKHHQRTGHATWVESHASIRYGDQNDLPGQMKMFGEAAAGTEAPK